MDLAKLNIEINSKDALTANKRLGRLAVTGKGLENRMVSLSTSSRQLTGRMSIAAKRFRTLGSAASRLGKRLSLGVTAPLVALGATAAKIGSQFEKEMTRINTLVGLSADKVDNFSQSVLDLASTTGRGPQELARALFTVTSAGARGAESLQILEQAAKASAIGLGDTQEIARATTAVLQAYGKENISAARATEILVSTVREGNLEASDLAPVLGRVLGMASQLGITFEEVGANIATFTRLGVGAEEAVVGLRGVMNSLIKPTTEGRKALDQAGTSFEQLRKSVEERGLAETMRDLVGLFQGNQEALSEVIPNVRALANVLGTAAAQGESYSEIIDNIITNHGLVEEGFKTVGETAAFQWEQAKSQLKVAAISLRDSLLPAMKAVVGAVKDAAQWFSDMDDATQQNVVTFAKWAIAAGPVVWAVGKLISGLPTLITLFKTLTALLATNPWTALAGVIGGLAALLIGKYLTSTNKATEATSNFEKAVRESGKSVKQAASELEGLTLQKMFDQTLTTLENLKQESRNMKTELLKQFQDVQEGGMFVNATFQEWLETLEETYGRSGKTGRFMDMQDTIQDLKEQKQLIRRLNKLENQRANVMGTVGGEYDRLSSFQAQQIKQQEELIDRVRTDLGLKTKYAEVTKNVKDDTKETVTAVTSITDNWEKFIDSVPDAERIIDPLKVLQRGEFGTSIEEAGKALSILQQKFEKAVTPHAREQLKGYIDEMKELIQKMGGAENATENLTKEQDKLNGAIDSFGMEFSSALEDAIVEFESLRDVAQAFIQDLIRIAARSQIITPLKDALVNWLGTAIGGGSGGGGTQQNAKGGVFSGMATMGNQMFGEAGPEAVLPLTRNSQGQLAVHTAGGGGGNVQVNIHNYSGQEVETKERQTANGGRSLDVMIGSMMAKDVQKRGPMARSLESAYGLNRKGKRRN